MQIVAVGGTKTDCFMSLLISLVKNTIGEGAESGAAGLFKSSPRISLIPFFFLAARSTFRLNFFELLDILNGLAAG